MSYDLENYYYHTVSKDDVEKVYQVLESILKDGLIKSQQMLNKNEKKFNDLNYISLSSYTEDGKYKSFILDEDSYKESKLANMFNDYNSYLEYMSLDNFLEEPITRDEYFYKHNTSRKKDYYHYLDSISRTYPVDISYLFRKTNDKVYKYILDITQEDVINCYKSDNCFDEYVRKSKSITFVFPKSIDVVNVSVIPNLPSDIEFKLVEKISNDSNRYSNQIGEVQIKDLIDVHKAIGIIVSNEINKDLIRQMITVNNYKFRLFELNKDYLKEI